MEQCCSHFRVARLGGQGGAESERCDSLCIFNTPGFDNTSGHIKTLKGAASHPPGISWYHHFSRKVVVGEHVSPLPLPCCPVQEILHQGPS